MHFDGCLCFDKLIFWIFMNFNKRPWFRLHELCSIFNVSGRSLCLYVLKKITGKCHLSFLFVCLFLDWKLKDWMKFLLNWFLIYGCIIIAIQLELKFETNKKNLIIQLVHV